MSAGDQIQKLEALLERVRRNRTAAPVRSAATLATPSLALEPLSATTAPATVPFPSRAPAAAPPAATPPTAPVAPPAPAPPPAAELSPPPEPSKPATVPEPPAAASWHPEPGSAVQPRPSTMPPVELSDDDLLEVSTLPPAAEQAASVDVVTADDAVGEVDVVAEADVEEEAPVSSSRFRVPGTLDEAIASATHNEPDLAVPVQTPPPESGPQEALPAQGLEASRVPDVDQLEADLMPPPSMGPTAEQLGETIELEEPRGPELEIDVVAAQAESEPAPPEELEVALPRQSLASGLYDVQEVQITAPPPEAVVTVEAPGAPAAATIPSASGSSGQPELTVRPALGATDVASMELVAQASPKTFLELLDGSLSV